MASRYADLLSDADLVALGQASGHRIPDEQDQDVAGWFRSEPDRIEAALDDPATLDHLFACEGAETMRAGLLETISPVLIFAVIVHRGAGEIGEHAHVPERMAGRAVVPVFDGERLARFSSSVTTRLLLVELLGSYTRVLSGPRWERTDGKWRRRRFSEMNPAQLAQLAASLPYAERAGAYRRLGDLALFLNGVFPVNALRETLTPIDLERIMRSVPDQGRAELLELLAAGRVDATGPVMAAFGPRWYRMSAELIPIPSMSRQLNDLAENFQQARRFLNFVTDRYLWNRRGQLFPAA